MKAPASDLPAALGFRMPAEWEEHEATWIAWPHERRDWPGKLGSIPWVYGEVVHDDYAKELRWARMGGLSQGLVRTMAHDVANLMISQALYLRGLVRQGLVDPLESHP